MDPIGFEEANEMRSILETLFGMQALSWSVTSATYEAFGKLIVESKQSLKAMEWVPRPHSFTSPFKWSKKATRKAMVDYFKSSEGKPYLPQMRSAGLKKHADFEKARTAVY